MYRHFLSSDDTCAMAEALQSNYIIVNVGTLSPQINSLCDRNKAYKKQTGQILLKLLKEEILTNAEDDFVRGDAFKAICSSAASNAVRHVPLGLGLDHHSDDSITQWFRKCCIQKFFDLALSNSTDGSLIPFDVQEVVFGLTKDLHNETVSHLMNREGGIEELIHAAYHKCKEHKERKEAPIYHAILIEQSGTDSAGADQDPSLLGHIADCA